MKKECETKTFLDPVFFIVVSSSKDNNVKTFQSSLTLVPIILSVASFLANFRDYCLHFFCTLSTQLNRRSMRENNVFK